jgi:hypothetical protein
MGRMRIVPPIIPFTRPRIVMKLLIVLFPILLYQLRKKIYKLIEAG